MKKIIKYLSVFMVMGALGLQTINVSALSCDSGEVVHTNYYLFLDVNPQSYYQENLSSLSSGSYFYEYTRAKKYNNIPSSIEDSKKIATGQIDITDGSDSTNSGSDLSAWSVVSFWKAYYNAASNMNTDTLVYDDGKTSYILHDSWDSCTDANCDDYSTHASARTDYLLEELDKLERGNNYGSSDLVKNGTALPDTTIEVKTTLTNNHDGFIQFQVQRGFTSSDLKSGVVIAAATKVYSPAVYMIQFCEAETSSSTSTATVQYDANTDETVTNMPSDETFDIGNCYTISSKTPQRSGYTFKGWSTNGNSSTVSYEGGDEYCESSDLTLFAVWVKNGSSSANVGDSFTITYDANGGKNAPATQTGTVGTCTYISSSTPTLANNNFLGWSTDPKAKEADSNYEKEDCYDGSNGSITLYAVWQTQTGISSHLVLFGAVALASGAILLVAKKKNLLRQI